jgi:transcriptional regulator GlxA family with amidase domain
MELLENTDMSIAEIAVLTGFTGGSYYAEIFRKYYACTPSEYRAKIRKNK